MVFTAKSPEESADVLATTPKSGRRVSHLSRQNEFCLAEQIGGESELCNLSKLFNKSLLAELITENTWMDRLRRVIERNDRYGFELMGPYTKPLWHQLSVFDDCILVDNGWQFQGSCDRQFSSEFIAGIPVRRRCWMCIITFGGPTSIKTPSTWPRSVEAAPAMVRTLNISFQKLHFTASTADASATGITARLCWTTRRPQMKEYLFTSSD